MDPKREGGDSTGFNTFSNDGSFLEQFKKMQQTQSEQEVSLTKSPKPSVSMKLGGMKRKGGVPGSLKPKAKSSSVRRAFGDDSPDSEEGEGMMKKPVKGSLATNHNLCMYVTTIHNLCSV